MVRRSRRKAVTRPFSLEVPPDDFHDMARAAAEPGIHREETAVRHPCERDVHAS